MKKPPMIQPKMVVADCSSNPDLEALAGDFNAYVFGESALGLKTVPSDVPCISISSNKDIEKAAQEYKGKPHLILEFMDDKMIPAENAIVQFHDSGTKLLVRPKDLDSALNLSGALQWGVDGFIVSDADLLKELSTAFRQSGYVELVDAKVVKVGYGKMADRACVDFNSLLEPGEGVLAGEMANFLVFSHAETEENPYVGTRDFRCNVGPVSEYILGPDDKTFYLNDLRSGDELMVVNSEGDARVETVGRVKIERRSMTRIELEYDGIKGVVYPQTAETVKLMGPKGAIATTHIKAGDMIYAHVKKEQKGRHFGKEIEEFVLER